MGVCSSASPAQTVAILLLGAALLYVAWRHNCLSRELRGVKTLVEASVSLHDLEEHVMPAIDGLQREAAQLRREMRQAARATATAAPKGFPATVSRLPEVGAAHEEEEEATEEEEEAEEEQEEEQEEEEQVARSSGDGDCGGGKEGGEDYSSRGLFKLAMPGTAQSGRKQRRGGDLFNDGLSDLSLLVGMSSSLLTAPRSTAFPLLSGGAAGDSIPVTRVIISGQSLPARMEETEREDRIQELAELVDQSS
jgi:hypothetical protein